MTWLDDARALAALASADPGHLSPGERHDAVRALVDALAIDEPAADAESDVTARLALPAVEILKVAHQQATLNELPPEMVLEPGFVSTTLVTVVIYVVFTIVVTNWRTLIRRDFEQALADCDAIATPTSPTSRPR